MLTVNEYQRRLADFQRGSPLRCALMVGLIIGGLFACHFVERWAGRPATIVALIVAAAHPWILWPVLAFQLQKRFGLLCPYCNRCLVGMGQRVEATRKCRFCGAQVLE